MTANVEGVGPSRTPGLVWIGVCTSLCLAIIAYALMGYRDATGSISYEIGYNLPLAGIVAGALHLMFRKREGRATAWLGFVLIYIALVIAVVIANGQQKAQMQQAASDIRQTLSAANDAVARGEPVPAPSSPTATGTSESARTAALLKTLVNRPLAQRRAYDLELTSIGWEKMMDGSRLEKDTDMAESDALLRQAKQVVTKYKSKTTQLFASMRQDIQNSDLSPSTKQSMLLGFDKASARNTAQIAEIWALEEQALDQIGGAIDVLRTRRNGWVIQDDQVVFRRQADLDRFNAHITKVQQIVARQEEMQKASMQRAHESLDRIGQ